ncbi:WD repeat-containing protein 43, partial [Mucuna pruriens]
TRPERKLACFPLLLRTRTLPRFACDLRASFNCLTMASTDIRGILTAFNPSLDFFAITAGDGRVKIWDALRGQVQTEFADITSTHSTTSHHKSINGHLALDYTCIKWLSFERKRKRKHVSSLLVLGTGSGDVLALDVAAGQLSWRITDCHPGGVRAIASSAKGSSIYTAGADGMVCVIDFTTGNLLEKFKASTKAVSCMSVSPDGKTLATAAAQLKIFNCSNHKKIQKFSGHPGSVRCMVFTEDGKYILSSAVGERYVAVWRIDGTKKQSASCVLAMEHPAVFLDSRCIDSEEHDETGICVLAISEIGICYLWFGSSIDELRNAKPTKISLSLEDMSSRNYKGALPAIYAAKLQGIQKPASGQVFLVYGLLVKPSFRKIQVDSGMDVKLNVSHDGVLLPMSQSLVKSKKGINAQTVTALDRANAEDALLPIPKVFDSHEKEKAFKKSLDKDVIDDLHRSSKADSLEIEDDMAQSEIEVICMEDRLRSLGMLSNESEYASNIELCSLVLKGIDLEAAVPVKKIRASVLSMESSEAFKLLEVLLAEWLSRSSSGKYILPWIYSILVNHGHNVIDQESVTRTLDSLEKITNFRGAALQPLLQLSGRLQLVTSQIDKASQTISHSAHELQTEESEDEDEDEYYHEEEDDASEISSDDES